jgi:VanZ family protein
MLSDFRPPRWPAALLHGPRARQIWQLLFWLLVLAVLYLALAPAPPKGVSTGWDKANHSLAFMALSAAGFFAYAGTRTRLAWLQVALLALGGGIEIAQYFDPPRSAEWQDWLADAVGMAIGTALAYGAARGSRSGA